MTLVFSQNISLSSCDNFADVIDNSTNIGIELTNSQCFYEIFQRNITISREINLRSGLNTLAKLNITNSFLKFSQQNASFTSLVFHVKNSDYNNIFNFDRNQRVIFLVSQKKKTNLLIVF